MVRSTPHPELDAPVELGGRDAKWHTWSVPCHHTPADWKVRAQMVLPGWTGKTPNEITAETGCHQLIIRIHLKRLTLEGIAGMGMRKGI